MNERACRLLRITRFFDVQKNLVPSFPARASAAHRKRNATEPLTIEPMSPWRRMLIAIAPFVVISLALALAFWPVKDHQLLRYDDYGNVVLNPYFQPLTVRNVADLWRVPYFGTYSPVTYCVLAMETWLARASENCKPDDLVPQVFHLANLGLHMLAAWIALLLIDRLVEHRGAATLGALMFGLHPCQVESVAWITEAKTTVSGILALAALWQYVVWRQLSAPAQPVEKRATSGNPRKPAKNRWLKYLPSWQRSTSAGGSHRSAQAAHYVVATSCFSLAILAKPSAASLPVLALALDIGWLGRSWRRSLWSLSPWFVLAAGLTVITKIQQGDDWLEFVAPLWARLLIAADALGFYLLKLLVPLRLAADYGRTPAYVLGHYGWNVLWLPLAIVGWFLARRRIDRRYQVALAISLAALLPVSGLIPFSFQDTSTVADRYLYLPLIGVALASSWFLATHWRPASIVAAVLVLIAWSVMDWRQTQLWHDDASLARWGLQVNPRSALLKNLLGSALMLEGRNDEGLALYRQAADENPKSAKAQWKLGEALMYLDRAPEAIECYRRGLLLNPSSVECHRALAAALKAQGQVQAAIDEYRRSLQATRTPRIDHLELGQLLAQQQNWGEAIRHFRAVLTWQHEDAQTWISLGEALNHLGDSQQAAMAFGQAVRIRPDQAAAWLGWGTALAQAGDSQQAIKALNEAVQLDPSLRLARQNLATVLAGQGRPDEAVKQLQIVLEADPGDANANFNLGILLSQLQHFDAAVVHLRTAIAANPRWIEPRLALAHVLESRKRYDIAAEVYRDLLQLAPRRADVYRGLGLMMVKQARTTEAVKHLSAALVLDPDDTESRAALEKLGVRTVPKSDPAATLQLP